MPEPTNPPPITQNIDFKINVSNANDIEKTTRQFKKLIDGTAKAQKHYQQFEKKRREATRITNEQVAKLDSIKNKKILERQKKFYDVLAKVSKKNVTHIVQQEQKIRDKVSKTIGGGAGGGAGGFGGGGGGAAAAGAPKNFTNTLAKVAAVIGSLYVAKTIAVALSDWVKNLGFAEARARALAGSFREIQKIFATTRDQQFFTQFAEQDGLARRFSSGTELRGLKKLRESLSSKLGDDFGTELALKLTASFKNNTELQTFLATASVDVKKALGDFESVDVSSFATALAAINQKSTELTKTAVTLESAWQRIKETAEGFVRNFVEQSGGDLDKAIANVTQTVVRLINEARELGSTFKSVLTFINDGFGAIDRTIMKTDKGLALFIDYLNSATGSNRIDEQIAEMERLGFLSGQLLEKGEKAKAAGDEAGAQILFRQAQELANKSMAVMSGANAFFEGTNKEELPQLIYSAAEHYDDIDKAAKNAADAAAKQRSEINKMLTPTEKISLQLEKMDQAYQEQDMNLKLIQSRLARFESSPFGFANVYEEQINAAKQIDTLLDANRAKQEQVGKLNQNLQENRERLVQLQIDENQLLAERNKLLQAQSRGYLDAITAQAFGAGRFQKIITSQDQAIAKALQHRVAKTNPGLGLIGSDAANSTVNPFRFGTDVNQNQQELDRYQSQLRHMLQPFVNEISKAIPPIANEAIGRAVSTRPALPVNKKDNLVDQGKEIVKGMIRLVELMGNIEEPQTPEATRPTRSGGRTAMGTK